MSIEGIYVRSVRVSDTEAISSLCSELGYEVDVATITERVEQLSRSGTSEVLLAETGAGAAGWIEVAIHDNLLGGRSAVIEGMVVTEALRGKGLGQRLLERAERWAAERGVKKMLVRSRATRKDAHRFYEREGYALVKTSAVFEKALR